MVSKRDKFACDLIVGGTAAAISKTAVAPIERVKLLLQVQYSHRDILADQRYKGILDAFSRVQREQGFLSFWRGNLTNLARYFPSQALNFAFHGLYTRLLLEHMNRDLDFWQYTARALISGGLAGSTTLCFVYPLDFIYTRLSADIGSSKANRTYTGFTDCLSKTVKTEGVIGLYRGFHISIQTYFIYRAVYFGMYDTIRHYITQDKTQLNFLRSFLIAQTVSATAAYIIYPWDTVRRRMLIKGTLTQGRTFHVANKIIKEEGVKGLFKGALANVFRTAGGALVMAIYEEIQKHV